MLIIQLCLQNDEPIIEDDEDDDDDDEEDDDDAEGMCLPFSLYHVFSSMLDCFMFLQSGNDWMKSHWVLFVGKI